MLAQKLTRNLCTSHNFGRDTIFYDLGTFTVDSVFYCVVLIDCYEKKLFPKAILVCRGWWECPQAVYKFSPHQTVYSDTKIAVVADENNQEKLGRSF